MALSYEEEESDQQKEKGHSAKDRPNNGTHWCTSPSALAFLFICVAEEE